MRPAWSTSNYLDPHRLSNQWTRRHWAPCPASCTSHAVSPKHARHSLGDECPFRTTRWLANPFIGVRQRAVMTDDARLRGWRSRTALMWYARNYTLATRLKN